MKQNINKLINSLENDSKLIFNEIKIKNRDEILKLFKYLYKITNNFNFLLKEIVKNKKYESDICILFEGELKYKEINRDSLINVLKNLKEENIEGIKLKQDAIKYKTHSTTEKSKTGLLNIRENKDLFLESNLKTMILTKEMCFEKNEEIIIIIENYKIFELDYINKYLTNFKNKLPQKFFIAYGGGEMINNEKFKTYLNSFKKVFYYGDYDNNGYKIWERLNKNVKCEFILPKEEIFLDIQKYIVYHNKEKEDIPKITNELKQLFNKDIVFEMQQEMFL